MGIIVRSTTYVLSKLPPFPPTISMASNNRHPSRINAFTEKLNRALTSVKPLLNVSKTIEPRNYALDNINKREP